MSTPKDRDLLSPWFIAQLFTYDPETGEVRRKKDRGGQMAGALLQRRGSGGYLRVRVCKKTLLVHRVAWCLHYGNWPSGLIDHINGDTSDNRLSNLRDVSQQQNLLNQHVQRPSALGVPGVSRLPGGRYRARMNLTVEGRRRLIHLGVFDTPAQAGEAYQQARKSAMEVSRCS